MSTAFMPLKFECSTCHQLYFQHYKNSELHYPECPTCHQSGLLIGTAEADDVLKHPYSVLSSIVKQTLNTLDKAH